MSQADWLVLAGTLLLIVSYGIYKSRTSRNLEGYFLSNRSMPWWLVLLSIMGTQASAITFLSAPGQAYTDGMRFVQYYFGLPLAMVVICVSFVPLFRKWKVFTAYEFLEQRFDLKTRLFTSFLFLLQRGLSTGISIFAPSIILSSLLGWNIYWTNLFMGGLLIIYTVSGGARAVAYTQQLQLVIIFAGMFLAGWYVVHQLPGGIGLSETLRIGGELQKMNVITTGFEKNGSFDWSDRYNIISGLIGGFFLALSYFGTDQSQVGRYLTARSLKESRLGLLMNGLVKVPMQFSILLIGILVFSFYQFNTPPVFFNEKELVRLEKTEAAPQVAALRTRFEAVQAEKKSLLTRYAQDASPATLAALKPLQQQTDSLRTAVKSLVRKNGGDDNDTNYIFLRFVVDYLPVGLVGLLIAIIFLASWGSIAAALNSLASSTMVDFHCRLRKREASGEADYRASRMYTLAWGVFCIIVAMFAYNIGNSLIEAVNILGSLFYGVILGVFLLAFYFPRVKGMAAFGSALVVQIFILLSTLWNRIPQQDWLLDLTGSAGRAVSTAFSNVNNLGFLWLNAVGAIGVVGLGLLWQGVNRINQNKATS